MKLRISPGLITGTALIASITAGFFFPQGSGLKPWMPFVLGIMLFFNFLSLTYERRRFVRAELLVFPLLAWGILPPLVLLIARIFFPPEIASGFFLAVITPPAISAVVMASLMGGERELPIVNSVVFNLLSPIAYTVLAGLYLSALSVHVPVRAIITEVGLVVLVPFVFSLIIRRIPPVCRTLTRVSTFYNPFSMMVVVYTSAALAAPRIKTLSVPMVLAILSGVFIIACIFYSAGLFLGNGPTHRRSFAVAVGQKNVGLGMMVAVNNFSPLTAVPVMLYLVSHHLINGILLISGSRRAHTGTPGTQKTRRNK
ncbi:MAG: bile acid:sodium symporter [Spirochaetota bacterium]